MADIRGIHLLHTGPRLTVLLIDHEDGLCAGGRRSGSGHEEMGEKECSGFVSTMSPAALVYWGPSGDSTPLENEQFGIGDDLR
jgi:hypothetical protein